MGLQSGGKSVRLMKRMVLVPEDIRWLGGLLWWRRSDSILLCRAPCVLGDRRWRRGWLVGWDAVERWQLVGLGADRWWRCRKLMARWLLPPEPTRRQCVELPPSEVVLGILQLRRCQLIGGKAGAPVAKMLAYWQ
jgi:hypothetical protein